MSTKIFEMTRHLRLQLLDLSRVSLRAVDYSIKAYKIGNPEFCTTVRDSTRQVNILHREITKVAHELLLREIPYASDVRFALSAVLIGDALRAVHAQAVKIAANSMRLSENGPTPGRAELIRMGEVVHCLVRLCIVAMFDGEVVHAERVLCNHGVERLFALSFDNSYTNVDPSLRPQAGCELAITSSLRQMARETYEIAGAIVFWLDGTGDGLISEARQEQLTIQAGPAKKRDAVTTVPDCGDPGISNLLTIITNWGDPREGGASRYQSSIRWEGSADRLPQQEYS